MLYGELDLDTIERHAFVDGRYDVAELAARLIDQESELKEMADSVDAAESEKCTLEEDFERYKDSVRDFLADLYSTIEEAARVSNRDAILRSIRDFKD